MYQDLKLTKSFNWFVCIRYFHEFLNPRLDPFFNHISAIFFSFVAHQNYDSVVLSYISKREEFFNSVTKVTLRLAHLIIRAG